MNNSTLYTGIGILGIVVTGVTAYMAGKRIWKDKTERIYQKALNTLDNESKAKVLNEVEKISNEEKSKEEAIEIAKSLIPTVAAGAISTYCVAKGEKISKEEMKKAKDNFNKYKDSAKQVFGEKGHKRIVDNIDKVPCNRKITGTHSGPCDVYSLDFGVDSTETIRTFYDSYRKEYFESTISKVLQAECYINRNFSLGHDATINDFYEYLGLEPIDNGDNIIWDIDSCEGFIDFNNRKEILDDGMEILVIDIITPPIDYNEED